MLHLGWQLGASERPTFVAQPSFAEHGFSIAADLLDRSQIEVAKAQIAETVNRSVSTDAAPLGSARVEYEPGFAENAASAERELFVRKLMDIESIPVFRELAYSPRVLEAVEASIGKSPRLIQAMAMIKPPGIGSVKDWHQDAPYFRLDPPEGACGVWIALDDVDEQNGCMQVVPASHRAGPIPHVTGSTGFRLSDEDSAEAAKLAQCVPLRPGAALLFHVCLCHFTAENSSNRKRRALQFHYVSEGRRSHEGAAAGNPYGAQE